MAQKWHQKAGVQTAMISGAISAIAVVLAVWLPAHLEAPQLREEKVKLEKQLAEKNHQIQELQTLLVPFKTVAFQNFTGTEAERLSQLALKLNDIQTGLETLSKDQAAIKEKTSSIATLPDGRVRMGGMITGEPTKLAAIANRIADAFNEQDFQKGYEAALEFARVHDEAEQAVKGAGFSTSSLNPDYLAEVYRAASDCARISRHYERGLEWAKKSLENKDSGQSRAAVIACLMLLNDYPGAQKLLNESLAKDDKVMVQEFRATMQRLMKSPLPDPTPSDYLLPHK